MSMLQRIGTGAVPDSRSHLHMSGPKLHVMTGCVYMLSPGEIWGRQVRWNPLKPGPIGL